MTKRVHGRTLRKLNVRDMRQRFLIVCEGKRTEPAYFRGFQVPGIVIEAAGVGKSAVQLVQKAIVLSENGDYDQVWCVFDCDDLRVEQIHSALELAANQNFRVALSNQSFELWYLLHFNYYHTAMTRDDYYSRLSELLGHTYEKNSPNMYAELLDRQETAIENARRLHTTYQPRRLAHDNPATTVHELVEELNKHRRP